MSAPTTRARTQPEQPAIHTPLTVDDRDAVDALRGRIARHAMLLNHTLSTWHDESDDIDELPERDRATLEAALIELAASIVTDADALRQVMNEAEQRTGGAR